MKTTATAIISAAMMLLGPAASAQQVSVTARIDSVEAMQGGLRLVELQVIQPDDLSGIWAIDHIGRQDSKIPPEIAPGVELHTKGTPDTTRLGNGRVQIDRQILVQPFDSGDVIIPGFEFIAGADTFRSNSLALKVYTADVDTMTTVHPMLSTVSAPRHFWDWVPDWIADYWWIYVLCIVAVGASIGGWWFYRRGGLRSFTKAAPAPIPPYEKAISALERLRNRKLCAKGQEKE
ncbi:MAG: hypothetical protein K2M97_02065, partial [Muribaculaceae bacterium]|nr:hypothetical protein [Muribaculaceae bacterium]